MDVQHTISPAVTEMALIPVATQKQAMDWSLVLASQGIESTIEHSAELGAWGLIVPSWEHDRAIDAIRQYRLENRRREWKRTIPQSGLGWHDGAVLWFVGLLFAHWMTAVARPWLMDRGIIQSDAVAQGEWWRLFTAVWLHADVGHLATNITTGLVFLGFAMARYGAWTALLFSFLAGVLGNVAGFELHSRPNWALGSSGWVMGALGLVAAQSVGLWRESQRAGRYILGGVAAGGFLFLLVGTNPASDLVAHTVGFVVGCLFGGGLSLLSVAMLESPKFRWASAVVFGVSALATWALAIR